MWSQLIVLVLLVNVLFYAAFHLRELLHLEVLLIVYPILLLLFLCVHLICLLFQSLPMHLHMILWLDALVGHLTSVTAQWIKQILNGVPLMMLLFLDHY